MSPNWPWTSDHSRSRRIERNSLPEPRRQRPMRLATCRPSGLLRLPVAPQPEPPQEVGTRVGKPRVRLVGRLHQRGRPLARILGGQGGGDDRHFGEAVQLMSREQHPGDPRVDRQARELAAHRCQLPPFVHCPQFQQERIAVGNGLG